MIRDSKKWYGSLRDVIGSDAALGAHSLFFAGLIFGVENAASVTILVITGALLIAVEVAEA